MATKTRLVWGRRWPDSTANFDLVLVNPEAVNVEHLRELLRSITSVRFGGRTLKGTAIRFFERWFDDLRSPLQEAAFVLLCNWFLTRGGYKTSELARRCEIFWDAMFACRPEDRLSSPIRNENHRVIPEEFERFWQFLMRAQDDSPSMGAQDDPRPVSSASLGAHVNSTDKIKVNIDAGNVRCEAESSAQGISELLRLISLWNASQQQCA